MHRSLLLIATATFSVSLAGAELETVVVTASRTPLDQKQLASSLSAISGKDLDMIGHTHINEALNRLPGTWVSRGNGQEHLTAIRSPVLTGAGSCGAFYIAEDGIPVRATGFCNVNQLFDLNSEQAERIEILRGPGTSVHGSNALHGVINSISRAPSPERGNQLAFEGGPHDYLRIKGSINGGDATQSWAINANSAHDGGFKDDSGFDQQKLSARFDRLFDHHGDELQLQSLLSISNLNQETAGYIEGLNAYKDNHLKNNNDDPQAYRNSTSARWYARLSHTDESGSGWQLTPYLRYTDMDFLQHFLPGTPLEQNGQKSVGIQSQRFQSLNSHWMLSYGADLEWTDAHLKETQTASVGFSPVFPQGTHYNYRVDSLLAAAFSRIDGQIGKTNVDAGIRFEHLNYHYDNRTLDGATRDDGSSCLSGGLPIPCRYSRPADRNDHFNSWSLQAGMHHPLSDTLAITARVAHGFRAPQATELYRLQNDQTSADIEQEKLDSLELGVRGHWETLEASATAFLMHKDNVIFQDSNRYNISGGKTRHQGLELAFNWQFAPHWTFGFQGSIAQHRYANSAKPRGVATNVNIDGNEIDTAPKHFHSAQLGWQYHRQGNAELEWVSMGDYYLEPANKHQYKGHDLLHLRVKHQLSANVSAGLRLQNLLNEDYAERADYAFGSYRYFIGEPRAVFVELSMQL